MWQQAKAQHDKHCIPHSFQIGDQVWLLIKKERFTGPYKKLKPFQYGPYNILKNIGENAFSARHSCIPYPTSGFQCRSTSIISRTIVGTKQLADSRTQRDPSICSGTSSLRHHCGMMHMPYKDELHSLLSSG